jgi:hypothetical protein
MRFKIVLFISMGLIFSQCSNPYSEYHEMLDQELESGVRNDSLFLSLHFNMTRKDFFATCWDLNKQGYIQQGPQNLSVQYLLNDEMRHPATFNFYPQFHEDKIYRMPVEISYQVANPTDPSKSADSLLMDVKDLMTSWYGDGFIYLENEDEGKRLFVKVDGNRRIRIFKKNLSTIAVDITDMPVAISLKEEDNEG